MLQYLQQLVHACICSTGSCDIVCMYSEVMFFLFTVHANHPTTCCSGMCTMVGSLGMWPCINGKEPHLLYCCRGGAHRHYIWYWEGKEVATQKRSRWSTRMRCCPLRPTRCAKKLPSRAHMGARRMQQIMCMCTQTSDWCMYWNTLYYINWCMLFSCAHTLFSTSHMAHYLYTPHLSSARFFPIWHWKGTVPPFN